MPLRFFNTFSQQKEDFRPATPRAVGVYVCGPTVYSFVHLGNARTFTTFDILVRYLRYKGYGVKYVRNFTDIDDKILVAAHAAGEAPAALADRFVALFQEDAKGLKLLEPDSAPRVTQHIPGVVQLIAQLIEKGYAYAAGGDVYFQVSRFAPYAELSRKPLDDLRAGERVQAAEFKREPLDFALWKGAKPGEPAWDSPWGSGRPGWHIECSAMAEEHLGTPFEIHGGGIDLIFPHHENERAQSEAASGHTFARMWMHCAFLNLDDGKMSKSKGPVVTLRDALARLDGESLRFFLLSAHYRHPLVLQDKSLADADARMEYFYETLRKVDARLSLPDPGAGAVLGEPAQFRTEFEAALDDDLNCPGAWAALSGLFSRMNELADRPPVKDKAIVWRTLRTLREDVKQIATILGVLEEAPVEWLLRRRARAVRARGLDAERIEALLAERAAARQSKDFATADRLRAELLAMGVEVMDGVAAVSWRVQSEPSSDC